MELKTISWKIENGIGHLVLDKPPANIMNRLFFEELSILIHKIIPYSEAKAVIFYGHGRHFSSGADTTELRREIIRNLPPNWPDDIPEFLKDNLQTFVALENLKMPTFAAIRGTCLGSAMELALFCRYRICAEGAVLGFPETSFGLIPGCGGSVKLTSIVGRARAIEILLGGKNFSSEEAYNWGIVHKIVDRKRLIEETVQIASAMIKR